MQAVIETLLFLQAQIETEGSKFEVGDPVVIHSDSKYVVELITHGCRSTTNIVMRDFLTHLWKRTRALFDIHIMWVRGHTMDVGNDLADKHAGEAAENDAVNQTKWRPRDWGFAEFRKDYPGHFAGNKTTAKNIFDGEGEGEGRRKPPNGIQNKRKHTEEEKRLAETQGRIEDHERNLKPCVHELQTAIGGAAEMCGRPKNRAGTKLPRDHPAMRDLDEAMALRSLAHDPIERFALNKRVTKCRSLVRTLIKVAQAEIVLNNPRVPRRKVVAQHRVRTLRGTEADAEDTIDGEKRPRSSRNFIPISSGLRTSRKLCRGGWI